MCNAFSEFNNEHLEVSTQTAGVVCVTVDIAYIWTINITPSTG